MTCTVKPVVSQKTSPNEATQTPVEIKLTIPKVFLSIELKPNADETTKIATGVKAFNI